MEDLTELKNNFQTARGVKTLMYEVRVLRPEEYAAWDEFIGTCLQATFFSSTVFASSYTRFTGLDLEITGVFKEDKLVGGVLIFTDDGQAIVPPFIYYTTICWDKRHMLMPQELPEHPVHKLIVYLQERYDKAELWLCPMYKDPRPFTWSKWEVSPRFTYLCRPDSIGGLLSRYSSRKRSVLRRALKKFSFVKVSEVLPAYIAMMAASFKRHDTELPIDKDILYSMLNELNRKGLLDIFMAVNRESGDTEAVAIALQSGSMALHWLVASIPGDGMKYLILNLLEYYKKQGILVYDLCGANTASIALFKHHFAEELAPCYVVKKLN